MRHLPAALACLLVMVFTSPLQARVQIQPDQERVWSEFVSWLQTQQSESDPFAGYQAKLQTDGLAEEEIKRQLWIIQELYWKRSEARPQAVTAFFDRLFSQPVRGFNTTPSALLVEAIKKLKPGTALDVGMGQGRNAVYLAQQKWTVTGYDISEQALAASQANAGKAGVRITTVKASHDTFNFGVDRWDLIVMTFAWAPVSDPTFVKKLHDSLRQGGIVVYENFVQKPSEPLTGNVHALQPNEAPKLFAALLILNYEESATTGDWGDPGDHLVRLVAQKK